MFRNLFNRAALVFVTALLIFAFTGCPEETNTKPGNTTKKVTGVTLTAPGGGTSTELWFGEGAGQGEFPNSVVLTAAIVPEDADNQELEWTVFPLVYVSRVIDGNKITITATQASGTTATTVTVKTKDGNFPKTHSIYVKAMGSDPGKPGEPGEPGEPGDPDNIEIPFTWTFGLTPGITGWANYADTGSPSNTTNAVYLNGMTLTAADMGGNIRWVPNQSGGGWTGCIQPNATSQLGGGATFLKIEKAKGPFSITLNYTGTGGSDNNTRFPQLYIDGTKVKDFQGVNGTNGITDSYDYAGTDSVVIQLGATNNIRLYGVKIEGPPDLISLTLETDRTSVIKDMTHAKLTVTRNPLAAADELEWIYNDTYFVLHDHEDDTVDISGIVVTPSPQTITVRAKDKPNISDSVTISVTEATGNEKWVESVGITEADFELVLGGTADQAKKQLNVTVLPVNADDTEVIWSSSNHDAATVSQSGEVTAHSKGTAIITATAADGSGFSDSVTVTVKQLVTEISLGPATGKFWLNVGGTTTINSGLITFSPAGNNAPSDTTIAWTSGNDSIVEVTATGIVTAKTTGATTLTATAADGSNKSASVNVEVIDFAAKYGTPDVHWDFGAASTGLSEQTTISPNDRDYEVNGTTMTLYGSSRGNLVIAPVSETVGGLGTTGSLNGGGATAIYNYAIIKNLQGPFKLVVLYNGGGGTNTGRSLDLYTAPAGTLIAGTSSSSSPGNGTLQVTGAAAAGTTFGTNLNLLEYSFDGNTNIDVGFRQISSAVRVQDVYVFYPPSTAVLVSAADNKITAGNTTTAEPPETLQFTARQNRQDITSTAAWSISSSQTINTGNTSIAGVASISAGGLLTAANDLTNDEEEIWVFASSAGENSTGYHVKIIKWEEGPALPANQEILIDATFAATSAETKWKGLIFGSGWSAVTAQSATVDGITFTHRTGNGGRATLTTRYLGIPLAGPARVTFYICSNNANVTSLGINTTLDESAAKTLSLTGYSMIGGGTNSSPPGPVIYTSAIQTPHIVWMWTDGSSRLFGVKIEYDY